MYTTGVTQPSNYALAGTTFFKGAIVQSACARGFPREQEQTGTMTDCDVDNIIDQLLGVRGARPGRQVNLTENEIKWLCTKGREIFQQQPVLLELEAPKKVSLTGKDGVRETKRSSWMARKVQTNCLGEEEVDLWPVGGY